MDPYLAAGGRQGSLQAQGSGQQKYTNDENQHASQIHVVGRHEPRDVALGTDVRFLEWRQAKDLTWKPRMSPAGVQPSVRSIGPMGFQVLLGRIRAG